MTKIGIIIGSTRPGRNGEAIGNWVHEVARHRTDAEFELVDLLDYKLPLLDEVYPPAMGGTKSLTRCNGPTRSGRSTGSCS